MCSGLFSVSAPMFLAHYIFEYMFKETTLDCFPQRVKAIVTSHPKSHVRSCNLFAAFFSLNRML